MAKELISAAPPGRSSAGGRTRAPSVALVQRSIPHYRISLFEKLANDPTFEWTFYCDQHDASRNSGLAAPLDLLRPKPISNRHLFGRFVVQSGIPVDPKCHEALLVDYGWTIISNPWLFARARAAGIATIGWSKGIPQALSITKPWSRRVLERASVSLCDALVVYGEISKSYFVDLGVDSRRIFVAQNTIDTRAIHAQRDASVAAGANLAAALGIDRSRAVVGFLGKIDFAKKVNAIVESFDISCAAGLPAQLLIAGRGPAASAIDVQIAASPNRDSIFRLPNVPPGEEGAVLQMLDLYAAFGQPGLGVLEAMAHGIAVICTPDRYPETELLADGETAFLSKDSSISSFAEAMKTAIRNVPLRRAIAARAEELVLRRATIENMVEAIVAAVEFALSQGLPRKHMSR